MILRLLNVLNVQGVVGIAAALALLAMLLIQKVDTRHWRKQSEQYEQLYRGEQVAGAQTVANYRAAADAARATDRATNDRVRAEQLAINERTSDDFETRLAATRLRAQRLQSGDGKASTDPCNRGTASVPGLPAAACGPPQAASQGGFSPSDALIATEQAIQLDELIRWVEQQHNVDVDAPVPERRTTR
jgi:hypothetical protein